MRDIIKRTVVVLVILAVLVFGFYMYKVERKMNWKLGYKPMVEETIRKMVKEEALK